MSKVAYLFPGQGSQAVGMGAALAEAYASARDVFRTADECAPSLLGAGVRLSALCFEGPEESLRQTIYTQPALYVTSAAALAALNEAGAPNSEAVAGHSVGEYAAMLAAGVFDFETGLRLIARRAQEMQQAGEQAPGTMAAVLGLSADVVVRVCQSISEDTGKVVDSANFNAPGQIVISGDLDAVAAASAQLKSHGAKRVLPLSVSGGFHSRLMAGASAAMQGVLGAARFSAPSTPLVANLTADYVSDAEDARSGLVAQIDHPVRWQESMERLVADGFDTFVEVGHGSVLTGLIRRIAPGASVQSAGTPEGIAKWIGAD